MKVASQIRVYRLFQNVLPIWSLRQQSRIVGNSYKADLAEAEAKKDFERCQMIMCDLHSETDEYEDKILSIQSRRLVENAKKLFIYDPDLKWEYGNYGDRYLEAASASKLHHAVREQQEKIRDFYLKLITALTGLIGVMIGLIAVFRK